MYNLILDCLSLFWENARFRDMFDVDFKIKIQKGTISSYFAYYFRRENKTLSVTYDEEVNYLKLQQCQNWFAKFHY